MNFPRVDRGDKLSFALIVAIVSVVTSCSDNGDGGYNISHKEELCKLSLPFARDINNYRYEIWHFLQYKSGKMEWNGQDVDQITLNSYMNELNDRPAAGNLVVHMQPGIDCTKVDNLNEVLKNNSLCLSGRCLQDVWDYKKPIVN
jgi:hypothetical protein